MPISPIGNLNFINQNAAYPSTQHANELAKEGFATAANMSEFKEKERTLEKLEKVAQSSQISDEVEEKKEQEQGKKQGKNGHEEDEAEAMYEDENEPADDEPVGFLTSLAGGAEALAAEAGHAGAKSGEAGRGEAGSGETGSGGEAAERGVAAIAGGAAKFAATEPAKSGRSPAGVGLVEGAGVGEAERGGAGSGRVAEWADSGGTGSGGVGRGGAGSGGVGRGTTAAHHLDLRI